MLSGFSHVWLFVTLWIIACQAPLCMGFSRQEYWSGLPFPSPGDLPDPGVKPVSPALAAWFFTTASPGKLSPYDCIVSFMWICRNVFNSFFNPCTVGCFQSFAFLNTVAGNILEHVFYFPRVRVFLGNMLRSVELCTCFPTVIVIFMFPWAM